MLACWSGYWSWKKQCDYYFFKYCSNTICSLGIHWIHGYLDKSYTTLLIHIQSLDIVSWSIWAPLFTLWTDPNNMICAPSTFSYQKVNKKFIMCQVSVTMSFITLAHSFLEGSTVVLKH